MTTLVKGSGRNPGKSTLLSPILGHLTHVRALLTLCLNSPDAVSHSDGGPPCGAKGLGLTQPSSYITLCLVIMMTEALKAIDTADQLAEEAMSAKRLDRVRDQLQLIGSVIALKTLLEEAHASTSSSARVSAARALLDLEEDPEVVAQRLRSSVFAEMSVDELEAVIETGIIDPEEAMRQVQDGSG